jgi:hypothetical protein
MAVGDVWGNSWASSWGVSWGQADVAPPTPEQATQTPAGRKTRRQRLVVEIDDELFEVESVEHARALLDQAKELSKETAKAKSQVIAAKVFSLGDTKPITSYVPKIRIESAAPEVKAIAQEFQNDIAAIYEAAISAAIHRMRAIREEEDELIEIMMRIL